MKWPIIHKECGKVAFYALRDWRLGGIISADSAQLLDGSTPPPHGLIICGSCDRLIRAGDILSRLFEFGDPIEDH